MTTAIVVPSNRPDRLAEFCRAWEPQLHRDDVRLIVVEDAPCPTEGVVPAWWGQHYCWQDIDDGLGSRGKCIPRKSGGIRDLGFWVAGQDSAVDVVITLDDDVRPVPGVDLIREHRQALDTGRSLRWWEPVPGFRTRGYPYQMPGTAQAPTMLNHGLWQGFPDVDALTQLAEQDVAAAFAHCKPSDGLVPPGMYYTQCIMNVAVRREALPLLWMACLPDGLKRWDDIWSGIIFKRVADLHGWAVSSGHPTVQHDRASSVVNNLRQEMLGYGMNEEFWQVVDRAPIGGPAGTPLQTWAWIWRAIGERFPALRETARLAAVWAGLWEGAA